MSEELGAIKSRVFETKISQLDALLKDGGIVIPDNPDNPSGISILVKGPAGAGKSTLALLLAAKCAKDGGASLYCALEQSGYSIKRLARSLNVDETGWRWLDEDGDPPDVHSMKGFVYLSSLFTSKKRERDFDDYLELLLEQTKKYVGAYGTDKISIIVIDSLNVFGRSSITRLEFEALKRGLSDRNRILIFVGESDEKHSIWDRLVDVVIELDSKTLFGEYFLRTISLAKARFQNHILGSHVIKIKGKGISALPGEKVDASFIGQESEVGFFIYPSLHYHLSVAIERKKRLELKQEVPSLKKGKHDTSLLETGFSALDGALDGGVKRGTMTAISSNLSYVARGIGLSFLAKGVENGERSLYLSLQDDPDSITKLPADKDIATMFHKKDLVIRSFRPGFISAEEFVDRIINEILDAPRLNARFQRVLFDDVSQIGLRFPLLKNAPVFLPTLMDIFKFYDMTAFFLSTTISSGDLKSPPKDDLYDLVNTVIEVQGTGLASEIEAVVRIRKIAEQFYVPQQLKLLIERQAGGLIHITEQEPLKSVNG